MFRTVLISICTLFHLHLHGYMARLPLPVMKLPVARNLLAALSFLIWVIFCAGVLMRHSDGRLTDILEILSMNWTGILLLSFCLLFPVDILTIFGLIQNRFLSGIRIAGAGVVILLTAAAFFQALRVPVVRDYPVAIPDLPPSLDKTVIVALSDLHLGPQISCRWLAKTVDRANQAKPDLIFLIGDIFEGHGPPDAALMDQLHRLTAPLGVWAVNGNHEFYGIGAENLLNAGGFHLLRNRHETAAPELAVAGVDDLTWLGRRHGARQALEQTFSGDLPPVTLFLSHSPLYAETAARAGAALMLCGHTHGGQIWPFGELVKRRYPLFYGRYTVDGMPVIVSSGAGTWGPRMRLWRPGEMLRITLEST